MTILHVPTDAEQNFINIVTNIVIPGSGNADTEFREDPCVPSGVYRSIDTLLEEINEISCVADHLKFQQTRNGYVAVQSICEACTNLEHAFYFSPVLNKILGFTHFIGLFRTGFQTIDIDIRDEFRAPIPFEHGTLTVTSQFKRVD